MKNKHEYYYHVKFIKQWGNKTSLRVKRNLQQFNKTPNLFLITQVANNSTQKALVYNLFQANTP